MLSPNQDKNWTNHRIFIERNKSVEFGLYSDKIAIYIFYI